MENDLSRGTRPNLGGLACLEPSLSPAEGEACVFASSLRCCSNVKYSDQAARTIIRSF